MVQERRTHERVGIDVSARIFNSAGEIVMGEGKIMDLSSGGAKLITESSFGVGDVLQLEFVLRKPRALNEKDKLLFVCEVEAVWKSGEEGEVKIYGVKFVNISAVSKEILDKVVTLLSQEQGDI